jgi:CRISPR-associated protein Cmr6
MNNAPKTATLLVKLLEEQHQERSPHLFRQGIFTLVWRAKVGSFPFPNLETIVSAGEPCGRFDWRSQDNADHFRYDQDPPANENKENPPKYFGSLSELAKDCRTLPLHGYVPGSAIRGIVQNWAMKQNSISKTEITRLFGEQKGDNEITPGIVEFLDAWPTQPSSLTLDVVNPQERFQVYHDNGEQPAPHALYTFGDGRSPIPFTVAVRGLPGKANRSDIDTVWSWMTKALAQHGLGARTASGYGILESSVTSNSAPDPSHRIQRFDFILYSQGIEGAIQGKGHMELRPSHWRGWLRSWVLRFLLGVMSETNAHIILESLFGTIESTEDASLNRPKKQHRQGCVRVQLLPKKTGQPWGELSKDDKNTPDFYIWQGQVQISAPVDILEKILLPIVKFAASVGGVGRGWRRPLHFFVKKAKDSDHQLKFSRGTQLVLTKIDDSKPYQIPPEQGQWDSLYTELADAVRAKWGNRGTPSNLNAEVFSPKTCSIYMVPGPTKDPIDFDSTRSKQRTQKTSSSMALARGARPGQQRSNLLTSTETQRSQTIQWITSSSVKTRGAGMNLIYSTLESNPSRNYKGNREVGGQAARGGSKSSFCSWVSIRRINKSLAVENTECQEIVCLFLGQKGSEGYHPDRYQFLIDLENIEDSRYLFGVRAPSRS